MASQVYPPIVAIGNLINSFFPCRGLTLAPRGLAADAAVPVYDDDRIISDMESFDYVRLDARRGGADADGADTNDATTDATTGATTDETNDATDAATASARSRRVWVVVLIISGAGKYAHHGPDLRKLLQGIFSERAARDGLLDEIILVAEEEFFGKKNLTDVVREISVEGRKTGTVEYYCGAYPYHNFAFNLPEHKSYRPHLLMSPKEVQDLLQRELITLRDLPVIYTSDPPIVWNGGREGQVVKIIRDSQTAGEAIYYRHIKTG